MSKSNAEPIILLDCDVIRHFLSGGQLNKLSAVYPGRFAILDKVKDEICRSKTLKKTVEDFLHNFGILQIPFPKDQKIIIEYAYLRRDYDLGESACMAVAKHQKQYIASSNLKDIAKFCDANGITYLTTMDILDKAELSNVLSEAECDLMITKVLSAGSRLPVKTLKEYRDKNK